MWGFALQVTPVHCHLLTQVPVGVSLVPPIIGSSSQVPLWTWNLGRTWDLLCLWPHVCPFLLRACHVPPTPLGGSVAAHCSIMHPLLLSKSWEMSLSLSFLLHQVPLCQWLLPSPSASFNQALALFYCLCSSSFSSEPRLLETNPRHLSGTSALKQWRTGLSTAWMAWGGEQSCYNGEEKRKYRGRNLRINFKMLSSYVSINQTLVFIFAETETLLAESWTLLNTFSWPYVTCFHSWDTSPVTRPSPSFLILLF